MTSLSSELISSIFPGATIAFVSEDTIRIERQGMQFEINSSDLRNVLQSLDPQSVIFSPETSRSSVCPSAKASGSSVSIICVDSEAKVQTSLSSIPSAIARSAATTSAAASAVMQATHASHTSSIAADLFNGEMRRANPHTYLTSSTSSPRPVRIDPLASPAVSSMTAAPISSQASNVTFSTSVNTVSTSSTASISLSLPSGASKVGYVKLYPKVRESSVDGGDRRISVSNKGARADGTTNIGMHTILTYNGKQYIIDKIGTYDIFADDKELFIIKVQE